MTTDVARRLFTIDEYHQMAEAGILHEDDRLELVHGEIIQMSPIGNYHAAVVRRLNTLLSPLVAPQAIVDVQNPVKIGDHSEPEPDIMVLPFRDDYYASTGVTPADVLLLVEVSDSTLRYDRNTKIPLYAAAGIREVWILDVNKQQLEVYRQPSEERYQFMETLTRDDTVAATQLPLDVRVRELIG
ncbi:MAG: Uma2 family endonuclease [Tunicatimonas sp.]